MVPYLRLDSLRPSSRFAWRLLLQCSITALLVVAGGAVARGEIESDHVKRGLTAYDELDFPRCITDMEKALTESLTKEEKVAALKTLAFCRVAQTQMDEARAAFEKLLVVDPAFNLDRTISPRVRAVFDQAKKNADARAALPPPTLVVDLYPARPRDGVALQFSGTHPQEKADKIVLYYRTRGATGYSKVEAAARMGGRYDMTVPGDHVRGPHLEYYLAVSDEQGGVVARIGSAEQPLVAETDGGGAKKSSRAVPVAVGVVVALLVVGGVAGGVTVGVMRAGASTATVNIYPQ